MGTVEESSKDLEQIVVAPALVEKSEVGGYLQEDIDKIWDYISQFRCLQDGVYVGLKEGDFNADLNDFSEEHQYKVNIFRKTGSIVATDLKFAYDLIDGKDIVFHHLSCVTETRVNSDSAVCIHFKDNNEVYAVAIPGLNYVADEKTQQMLDRRYM